MIRRLNAGCFKATVSRNEVLRMDVSIDIRFFVYEHQLEEF